MGWTVIIIIKVWTMRVMIMSAVVVNEGTEDAPTLTLTLMLTGDVAMVMVLRMITMSMSVSMSTSHPHHITFTSHQHQHHITSHQSIVIVSTSTHRTTLHYATSRR